MVVLQTKRLSAAAAGSDFLDLFPDNNRIFFSDLGLRIGFVVEVAFVLVGVAVKATK